jgi:hypothetical protein
VVAALAWRFARPSIDHEPVAVPTPAGAVPKPASTLQQPAPPAPSTAVTAARKTLVTDPPGAAVFLGDQNLGTTPLAIEIFGEPKQVELRLAGFETTTKALAPDGPGEIVVKMTPKPAAPKPASSKRQPRIADRPQLAPR